MDALYGNLLGAAAQATPFLEICGDVIVGWMLLWRARIAAEAMASGAKVKDAPFYEGQIKSAEYYTKAMLPVAMGRMDAIMSDCTAVVDIPEEAFAGK
jgi:hypothetical protein